MMHRTLIVILFALLSCTPVFGQTSYKGLTPGQSTKADVERVLGHPTDQRSEWLFGYTAGGRQIYVQYSKSSPTAIRIQVIYAPPVERSKVLSAEGLPQAAAARRTNKQGALEEYFGDPKYVVLTYEANSQTQVSQVGYYSRELFEAASGISSAVSPTGGNWAGTYVSGNGTMTVSGGGSSVSAEVTWDTGDSNGRDSYSGCQVSGNVATNCQWSGTEEDIDKTTDRQGTCDLTLNGDSIASKCVEGEPSFHVKPGREWSFNSYSSKMRKGAVWESTYTRKQ